MKLNRYHTGSHLFFLLKVKFGFDINARPVWLSYFSPCGVAIGWFYSYEVLWGECLPRPWLMPAVTVGRVLISLRISSFFKAISFSLFLFRVWLLVLDWAHCAQFVSSDFPWRLLCHSRLFRKRRAQHAHYICCRIFVKSCESYANNCLPLSCIIWETWKEIEKICRGFYCR